MKAPITPDFRTHKEFIRWADNLPQEKKVAAVKRAAVDVIYFIHNWLWILSLPDGWDDGKAPDDAVVGWTQFRLWGCQERTLKETLKSRFFIVLKVRQIGLTWLMLARALWCCNFKENQIGAVFSLEEGRAKKMTLRVKKMWEKLPDFMREGRGDVWSMTDLSWENNSYLYSMPTTSYGAVSDSLTFAIFDEAALVEELRKIDLTEAIEVGVVEPLRVLGGWCAVISTGRMRGGWFYNTVQRILRKAKEGLKDRWSLVFIPWTDHPLLNEATYNEEIQSAANIETYKREHPKTIQEAFSAAGLCVFNTRRLGERRADLEGGKFPQPRKGYLNEGCWMDSDSGQVRMYYPPDRGGEYVIIVDPSEGKATGDYFGGHVLDVKRKRIAASIQSRWDSAYDAAHVFADLGHFYGTAMIIPEINKDYGFVEALKKECDYENIYRQRDERLKLGPEESRDILGWRTNPGRGAGSRQKILERLKAEVVRDEWEIADEPTLVELESFVSTASRPEGEPSPGCHDDLLMPFAIGVYVISEEPESIDPGSGVSYEEIDYGWEDLLDEDDAPVAPEDATSWSNPQHETDSPIDDYAFMDGLLGT